MEKEHITSEQQKEVGRLGNINGRWAVLFKAVLAICSVALPSLVALNVWFVTAIYSLKIQQAQIITRIDGFTVVGPRYTPLMAEADNIRLKQDILNYVSKNYPPDWLKLEIESIARRIEFLEKVAKKDE